MAAAVLETPSGDPVTVAKVHNFRSHKAMRDLTVSTVHTYYVLAGDQPVLVHNCDGEVSWVHENANKSAAAAHYEAGPGGVPSSTVPALDYVNGNLDITEVRFDDFDAAAGVLIDRKHGIATTRKTVDTAVRQSMALEQNGYVGRWEVPNLRALRRAQKVLNDAGVTNITAVLVKHGLPGCRCNS